MTVRGVSWRGGSREGSAAPREDPEGALDPGLVLLPTFQGLAGMDRSRDADQG